MCLTQLTTMRITCPTSSTNAGSSSLTTSAGRGNYLHRSADSYYSCHQRTTALYHQHVGRKMSSGANITAFNLHQQLHMPHPHKHTHNTLQYMPAMEQCHTGHASAHSPTSCCLLHNSMSTERLPCRGEDTHDLMKDRWRHSWENM